MSKNVKCYIERLFRVSGWTDAGQGWEGMDSTLALTGWEDKRRVVVLRRPLLGEMVLAQEDDGQQELGFIEADRKGGKRITGYEYAVRVTNLDHEILSRGQLTGPHAYFDKARRVLMRVSSQLQAWVSESAEQLNSLSVWLLCCDHLKRTLAAIGPPTPLRLLTDHANGVG